MRIQPTQTGDGTCYLVETTGKYAMYDLPQTAPPGTQFDYGKYENDVASCLAYELPASAKLYGAFDMRTGQTVQL